jgi:sirohydrochlorin cobaltochelatase
LSDAYLLVSHGSRDPRPQLAANRLAQKITAYLREITRGDVPILVGTAQLELAATLLHIQIRDFASQAIEQGVDRIVILPLFLIPGVHAMEDIPAEVALADREIQLSFAAQLTAAQSHLPQNLNKLKLVVLDYLGAHADFANLFAQNRDCLPSQSVILAHGSRRAGGNAIVEKLADNLNLTAAYWSVVPSLAEQIATLVVTGATEIGILPYFLFVGSITDAIATSIAELGQQYPRVRFTLIEPIGDSQAVVTTIGKILSSIDSEAAKPND